MRGVALAQSVKDLVLKHKILSSGLQWPRKSHMWPGATKSRQDLWGSHASKSSPSATSRVRERVPQKEQNEKVESHSRRHVLLTSALCAHMSIHTCGYHTPLQTKLK